MQTKDFSWLQPCNYIDQLDTARPDLKAVSAIVVRRTSARAEIRRFVPTVYVLMHSNEALLCIVMPIHMQSCQRSCNDAARLWCSFN